MPLGVFVRVAERLEQEGCGRHPPGKLHNASFNLSPTGAQIMEAFWHIRRRCRHCLRKAHPILKLLLPSQLGSSGRYQIPPSQPLQKHHHISARLHFIPFRTRPQPAQLDHRRSPLWEQKLQIASRGTVQGTASSAAPPPEPPLGAEASRLRAEALSRAHH